MSTETPKSLITAIKSLASLPNKTNNNYRKQQRSVIALINSKNFIEDELDEIGNTPLMLACTNELTEVALALVESGKSKPEMVNRHNHTALLIACKNDSVPLALAIIRTGQSNPGHANDLGFTALTMSCQLDMVDVALELIRTGQSNPGQVNIEGNNALLLACIDNLEPVSLALIETGESNPEQVNTNTGITSLISSCVHKSENVALKIIETGHSNPGHVDKRGNTALILSCEFALENVALKLIETGLSNPEHTTPNGKTALKIAKEKNLTRVVDELIKILKPSVININETGFNTITQETLVIADYLDENADNIVFKLGNNYYLTDKATIDTQLRDPKNIKYECRKAGETLEFQRIENIITNNEYFSLSSILGIQAVANKSEIIKLLNAPPKVYEIRQTQKKLASIISRAYIDGSSGIGADHCQPGKETYVYIIVKAIPKRGPLPSSAADENVTRQETKGEPTLNVMYKGSSYTINIHPGMTIEALKTAVLNTLINKGILKGILSFDVKFIYGGNTITDDSIVLDSLNPGGIIGQTMQVMISPKTTGGRKIRKTRKIRETRRKRKRRIRKTRRIRETS